MRCAFPTCDRDSSHNSSPGISFHRLPEEVSLRAAWMAVLGQVDWQPGLGSIICSEHFLLEQASSPGGHRQRADAVAMFDLRVCRICFATDDAMYSMTGSEALNEAYETLTGIMTAEEEQLPRYLCTECADRLMNCARFRRRSLQAHSMLLDVARRHGRITADSVQSMAIHSFSCDPEDSPNNNHFGFDYEDLYEANKVTVKESVRSMEMHLFNFDPEDFPNNNNFGFDYEVFDEENKVTVTRDYTRLDNTYVFKNMNGIKYEIDDASDHRNINSQDKANDIINVNYIKTENYDLEDLNKLTDIQNDTRLEDVNMYINTNDIKSQIDVTDNSNINSEERADNMIDINDIKTENDDLNNRDDFDDFSYTLKGEVTVEDDINRDEVSATPFDLKKDTVDDIKFENDGVTNQVGNEVTSNRSVVCAAGRNDVTVSNVMKTEHIDVAKVGTVKVEAPSSDCLECLPSRRTADEDEVRQEAERGTSTLQDLNEMKTEKQTLESCGELYSCHVCKKIFTRKYILNRHLRIHSGEKPYSCDVCKQVFSLKHHLVTHFTIHSAEKPHSCYVCKKRFKRKDTLLTHIRVHSRKKPYSCDVCKQVFFFKHHLVTHFTTHSTMKPHSCYVCKKTYKRKDTLLSHIRVHSRETYSCDLCRKSFKHNNGLKLHILKGVCRK